MLVLTLFTSVTLVCLMRNDVSVGQRSCPLSSPHLIRMCQPVTVTNKNHFYIDFSYFEHTTEDSCRCSFTAPTRGNFKMTATTFTPISNCGSKVEITINRVVIPGGVVQCKPDRFLPATAYTGEEVAVTIRSTSPSVKLAPYFYVATFPVNVTFTCNGSVPSNDPNTNVKSTMITTKSIGNESSEEKNCKTEQYLYIAGLALQFVIICILLSIIACLCRRRNEGIKNKEAQMYEECVISRDADAGNEHHYDAITNQPSNKTYLNTT